LGPIEESGSVEESGSIEESGQFEIKNHNFLLHSLFPSNLLMIHNDFEVIEDERRTQVRYMVHVKAIHNY
jgi:hypothetical protein